MPDSATPTAQFSFPSDWKSSISHWWNADNNNGLNAEHALIKRGLEQSSIQLVTQEERTALAANTQSTSINNKVAVLRDLQLDESVKGKDRKRWFLHFLEVGKPVKDVKEDVTVVTHGYGNGVGFYFQNLQSMTAQPSTRTYFLDWLGMGRSGRPNFPSIKHNSCDDGNPAAVLARVNQAESFFVDSLEEFRKKEGVEKMTLVGHSIGGYLSTAYALRHPDRVKKLILISPVGVPLSPYAPPKPRNHHKLGLGGTSSKNGSGTSTPTQDVLLMQEGDEGANEREIANALERQMLPSGRYEEEGNGTENLPPAPKTWWTYLWEKNYSPFGVLRATTFMGPSLLSRYASRRFASFPEEVQSDLFSYLYHISTARGSGEYCLAHLLAPGAFARAPLINRMTKLDIPITFIYGDHDWMDEKGGFDVVKKLKAKPPVDGGATERQRKESKVLIK
ncbi:alpha/beta-hydrolase [Meredithblackwellia eburnea MCA 4105]